MSDLAIGQSKNSNSPPTMQGQGLGAAIRKLIKHTFGCLGVEIRFRSNVARNREWEAHQNQLAIWRFVQRYQPRTILDIGSNEGQFAVLMRELVPEARLFCFEPLKSCYDKLMATLQRLGNAEGFHLALGDAPGEVTMHRNDYSPSSSLLPVGEIHVKELPHTAKTFEETVRIMRLDDILAGMELPTPLFVKMDVQGFEDRVLLGGPNTIGKATAVVIECGSYPLYEGQGLFDHVYQIMRGYGFTFRGTIDEWRSKEDGRILQFDALFERD